FLGLSVLASHMHVAPFAEGTPTVISQIGDLVYGGSPLGRLLYFALQAGTMLILVLAANTSFADFPRLASFHAGDNFMPRQLTKRGHRLVFSNGIIFLTVASIVLLLLTGAKVDRLIPLYAIGVFTSFTLSQAGMAKHHITKKEPGWRFGLFVNGTGAVMSLIVDFVVAHQRGDELAESWREHGLASIALELVDCPDRRLSRSAMTTVAHALADGQTEVCVVLPDRRYGGFWRRILHDQTAETLARDI